MDAWLLTVLARIRSIIGFLASGWPSHFLCQRLVASTSRWFRISSAISIFSSLFASSFSASNCPLGDLLSRGDIFSAL
ncbi:hypothetical protein C8J57DRAFT_1409564, partial [Mycena rebaudengoi]